MKLSLQPLIPVKRPIQIQRHSFRRLLLYLEWILLGMTAITEAVHDPRHQPQFPLLKILSIAVFGVMGLRLPMSKPISKVLYTGLEFGLNMSLA